MISLVRLLHWYDVSPVCYFNRNWRHLRAIFVYLHHANGVFILRERAILVHLCARRGKIVLRPVRVSDCHLAAELGALRNHGELRTDNPFVSFSFLLLDFFTLLNKTGGEIVRLLDSADSTILDPILLV